MPSIVQKLHEKGLINPPLHVIPGMQYETITGSEAYGVKDTAKEGKSDIDIYGFSIPYKDIVFPHLKGEIPGFGRQIKKFNQFQEHKIVDETTNKEYDITIYNIVKYFQLCMENNPNMIDTLFTPIRCITYATQISNLVRENRKLFLHKGSWFKFKGYSYSQLYKLKNKKILDLVLICKKHNICPDKLNQQLFIKEKDSILAKLSDKEFSELNKLFNQCSTQGNITKRWKQIEKYGYDPKFGYHVVRLLNEIEQILIEHDLDLERNREQLKSIRRGEWSLNDIEDYFNRKEKELEKIYNESKLRNCPDEPKIKMLLINCLEMHFGDLKNAIVKPKKIDNLIKDIKKILDFYKGRVSG